MRLRRKDYSQDRAAQEMIGQIDKYWGKLFADPITVQTSSGPVLIQPQRTNNTKALPTGRGALSEGWFITLPSYQSVDEPPPSRFRASVQPRRCMSPANS
jgi:hypothetical protein